MGVLVGFSWEQAFEGGVHVLAERTPQPVQTRLALASFVALVVITPWSRFFLSTAMRLQAERREKHHEQEDQDKDNVGLTTASMGDELSFPLADRTNGDLELSEIDERSELQDDLLKTMDRNSRLETPLTPLIRLMDSFSTSRNCCSDFTKAGATQVLAPADLIDAR